MKYNTLATLHIMWYESEMMREFVYVEDATPACVSLMNSSYIGSYNCPTSGTNKL